MILGKQALALDFKSFGNGFDFMRAVDLGQNAVDAE